MAEKILIFVACQGLTSSNTLPISHSHDDDILYYAVLSLSAQQSIQLLAQQRPSSLTLDFRDIEYDISSDAYAVATNFVISNDCWALHVDFFSDYDILTNHLDTPHSSTEFNGNHSLTVHIPASNLNFTDTNNQTYFRITAVTPERKLCSDDLSSQTFYRFLRYGIPQWPISSSSVVRLPIPTTTCQGLMFMWPRLNGGICTCQLSNLEFFGFNYCAQVCESHYKVAYPDNTTVVIENLANSSSDSFLVHFICDENPCAVNGKSCYTTTVVSTHRIYIDSEGPQGPITYPIFIGSLVAAVVFGVVLSAAVAICCYCCCNKTCCNKQQNYDTVND